MENKNIEQNSQYNGESPSEVIGKIVVTTLITCIIGGLFMYMGWF